MDESRLAGNTDPRPGTKLLRRRGGGLRGPRQKVGPFQEILPPSAQSFVDSQVSLAQRRGCGSYEVTRSECRLACGVTWLW